MVATSILSTDDEMNAMAGENVDVTGWVDGNKTAWGIQAENFLVVLSRYDWVANIASLTTNTKAILSEYVARYTAVSGIAYNAAGFADLAGDTDRIQAEDMLNIHIFRMNKIERLLFDQKVVTLMKAN